MVVPQSMMHQDLLDTIDKLRSQGVDQHVPVPQIIVVGDQSAGKSSVLEAISGMTFPTKEKLCTRFATELVLRRSDAISVRVSIIPGPERSTTERQRLLAFEPSVSTNDGSTLASVVESAKVAMGLSDAKPFSTDKLRVEFCGPTQPHLTMVDLPGLYRAGSKDQPAEMVTMVRDMVLSYMRQPRSVILAVVSAKSDFNNQEITEYSRQLDPSGDRTLGLITKPDCLDVGSESERFFFGLAQNLDVELSLGWHVVKNRSYDQLNYTLKQRDEAEEAFFQQGIWLGMDSSQVGVSALRQRLSNVLKDQILRELPALFTDIQEGISDCERRLARLGKPRVSLDEQRHYVALIGEQFTTLMTAAVGGLYRGEFFESASTAQGKIKRLRAIVQNRLTKFEEKMRKEGHTLNISEMDRSGYIDAVDRRLTWNRGCELPGTFSPLIIGELFSEQCQPWRSIASECNDDILVAVLETTKAIVEHIAAPETVDGILSFLCEGLDELKKGLRERVEQLLAPHYDGHPITYNHCLRDQVQAVWAERLRSSFRGILKKELRLESTEQIPKGRSSLELDAQNLLDTLVRSCETDMKLHPSRQAVDYMVAYYEGARKKFVDDFAVLAIEQCLISKLPALFGHRVIIGLDNETIGKLASESEETAMDRTRSTEKLEILETALRELRGLDKHRVTLHQDSEDPAQTNIPDDNRSASTEASSTELGPNSDRPGQINFSEALTAIRQRQSGANEAPSPAK